MGAQKQELLEDQARVETLRVLVLMLDLHSANPTMSPSELLLEASAAIEAEDEDII